MTSSLLRAKIPAPLFAALERRAAAAGVSLPTYLRALVESHVSGDEMVFRAAARGLAAASAATRKRVAASGGVGKKESTRSRPASPDEHVADPPLFGVAPRPSGLTAASERTRKRVSRAGVKSRGNKETERG